MSMRGGGGGGGGGGVRGERGCEVMGHGGDVGRGWDRFETSIR